MASKTAPLVGFPLTADQRAGRHNGEYSPSWEGCAKKGRKEEIIGRVGEKERKEGTQKKERWPKKRKKKESKIKENAKTTVNPLHANAQPEFVSHEPPLPY